MIQGTCAEVSKISMYNVWKHLQSTGGSIRNIVHDSILIDGVAESSVPMIKEIMEDFVESPNGNFKVPITVDIKRSSKSWGDMSDE